MNESEVQAFKFAGAVTSVSLSSFYVSVMLTLSEDVFSLLVPRAVCPSRPLLFFIDWHNMDASIGLHRK